MDYKLSTGRVSVGDKLFFVTNTMTCKNGKCDVKFKAKGKEVSFEAKPKPNKPGLHTTEVAMMKAYEVGRDEGFKAGFDLGLWMRKNTDQYKYISLGILIGGIVSAVIFDFFL